MPHPLGPMNAVVACDATSTVIPVSALKSPYQKSRFLTWTFAGPAGTWNAGGTGGNGICHTFRERRRIHRALRLNPRIITISSSAVPNAAGMLMPSTASR